MSSQKTHLKSRRAVLAGMSALLPAYVLPSCTEAGAPEVARAPVPRPAAGFPSADQLVSASRVTGASGYALMDVASGALVEGGSADSLFLPASVSKVPTALYAMDALGSGFRFRTRLMASTPVSGGELAGDLILQGGGDPVLDTDALAEIAAAAHSRGLRRVNGRFLADGSVLPTIARIDPSQPEYVSYNPAVSGLNLNFNRVFFEWKQHKGRRNIALEARARRFSPQVSHVQIDPVSRQSPLFTWETRDSREFWTVAEPALGRKGGRWLPVRDPESYAADVFRKVAGVKGLTLPKGTIGTGQAVEELVAWESDVLDTLLRSMLKYSNNMTAEVLGLAASRARGAQIGGLTDSGKAMASWMVSSFGLKPGFEFANHSGLSTQTKITPRQTVEMLARTDHARLSKLLKPVSLDAWGSEKALPQSCKVFAKTGTLNFVRGLAGYIQGANGRTYAFAIYSGDLDARAGVVRKDRERPPGAKTWRNRAKAFERSLLRSWAARFTVA